MSGDLTVTGNIIGNLTGKASTAGKADTATKATTASYFSGSQIIASKISASSITGSLRGNASSADTADTATSATKWTTSRNINGMLVNGTANRINYGICTSSAATKAKTVAITGFGLITGSEIVVDFTNGNSDSGSTLNVNDTGAKNLYWNNALIPNNLIEANKLYPFRYNGIQWEAVSTIYSSKAGLSNTASVANAWKNNINVNGMLINGTSNRINYGTCNTAGSTAAKVVNLSGFGLAIGSEISVKFRYTNTVENPTLKVGTLGAFPIYYRGKPIPYHVLLANKIYTFKYDQGVWNLVGNASSLNKTYLTYSDLGTTASSPGPTDIDDLIVDNEMNYLDIYIASAATAERYYLRIPDSEVGTIIDIGIRKNVSNTKLKAIQLARAGSAGPTIYLPDGSGGYPNVDISVGTFVKLYRSDENGWVIYRSTTF